MQLTSLCPCRQVDADKHREIGNRFDVKGFPTILYFARGKPVESHQPCVLPLVSYWHHWAAQQHPAPDALVKADQGPSRFSWW
jgi:thioredoxin-like negative regulator of GroEL